MKKLKITSRKKWIVGIVLLVAVAWIIFNTYFSHTPENDLRSLFSLMKSGDFEKTEDYLGSKYWDAYSRNCVETKPPMESCYNNYVIELNITKIVYNNQTDATIIADLIMMNKNETYIDSEHTFRLSKVNGTWRVYDEYRSEKYKVAI